MVKILRYRATQFLAKRKRMRMEVPKFGTIVGPSERLFETPQAKSFESFVGPAGLEPAADKFNQIR